MQESLAVGLGGLDHLMIHGHDIDAAHCSPSGGKWCILQDVAISWTLTFDVAFLDKVLGVTVLSGVSSGTYCAYRWDKTYY